MSGFRESVTLPGPAGLCAYRLLERLASKSQMVVEEMAVSTLGGLVELVADGTFLRENSPYWRRVCVGVFDRRHLVPLWSDSADCRENNSGELACSLFITKMTDRNPGYNMKDPTDMEEEEAKQIIPEDLRSKVMVNFAEPKGSWGVRWNKKVDFVSLGCHPNMPSRVIGSSWPSTWKWLRGGGDFSEKPPFESTVEVGDQHVRLFPFTGYAGYKLAYRQAELFQKTLSEQQKLSKENTILPLSTPRTSRYSTGG